MKVFRITEEDVNNMVREAVRRSLDGEVEPRDIQSMAEEYLEDHMEDIPENSGFDLYDIAECVADLLESSEEDPEADLGSGDDATVSVYGDNLIVSTLDGDCSERWAANISQMIANMGEDVDYMVETMCASILSCLCTIYEDSDEDDGYLSEDGEEL